MKPISRKLYRFCLAACVLGAARLAAAPSRPVGPRGNEYWRAMVFAPQGRESPADFLADFQHLVGEALAPMGINVIIFDMHWRNFRFTCRPEFAKIKLPKNRAFTRADARRMAAVCRAHGIRVMVGMNFLTHQNYGQLLKAFPNLQWPKSKDLWDPLNPETNKIAFAMADELLDAFQADGFHVGMDEAWGFYLNRYPKKRIAGWTPAGLFAQCVKEYHAHFVGKRHVTMLMWDDMFYRQHRGTEAALEMIPKDIILCHWKYSYRSDYPMLRKYIAKGFRVLGCPWKNPAATRAMVQSVLRIDNSRMLGVLYTTWYGRIGADLERALLRKKGWQKLPATVKGIAAGMRETLPWLGPSASTSLELLTPPIPGTSQTVYPENRPIRARFQVFRRGRSPGPIRRAAAQVFLLDTAGKRPPQPEARSDSADPTPAEWSMTLPAGAYRLLVRGTLELSGALPRRFRFERPGPSFCVGETYRLRKRLFSAIQATGLEPALSEIDHPPAGRAAVVIGPTDWLRRPAHLRGRHWSIGPWPPEKPRALVIVFPPHTRSAAGDFCEVRTQVSLPAHSGQVRAQLFLADNFQMDKWTRYRFYQLRCDGRTVWEQDILADRRKSRWSTIDLTRAVQGKRRVTLAFRVIDKRGVTEYPSTTILGPLRLVFTP